MSTLCGVAFAIGGSQPRETVEPVVRLLTSEGLEVLSSSRGVFGLRRSPKLGSDSFLSETGAQCFGLDGLILKRDGTGTDGPTPANPVWNHLSCLPSVQGLSALRELRGVFRGFIFSTDPGGALTLFTDHFARKPLYYAEVLQGCWVFGSDLPLLARVLRVLGVSCRLNETGAYCLLTFGYMLGDHTLIQGVRKVPPGSVCTCGSGAVGVYRFYELPNAPEVTRDTGAIVRELNELFQCGVQRQAARDLAVGARHLVTLSGGLDSRMTLAYLMKGTHNDVDCLTFSETGYLDHTIAEKIVHDYGVGQVFVPLDGGGYLTETLSDTVALNGGLVLYSGAAHQYHALKQIDCSGYGVLHTGQIGDLVLGSYLHGPNHTAPDQTTVHKCAYSEVLLSRIAGLANERLAVYQTAEMFAFYERCVNGVFNGDRMSETFLEPLSPFLDLEFAEYAFRIPARLRYGHRVYREWLKRATPHIARYAWEKYGARPSLPLIALKAVKLCRIGRAVMAHGRSGKGLSMNPFRHWWATNADLRDWMQRQYMEMRGLLGAHFELRADVDRLFQSGTLMEKTQVLTLLEAMRAMDID